MSDFKPGDVVNITIEGARVHAIGDGAERWLAVGLDDFNVTIPMGAPRVTVERADPEWWPPRPGDLLTNATGMRLFAMACGSNVVLTSAYGEQVMPQEAWEQRHDLTLVHREEES